jgi:hypothetical protein
VSRQFVYVLVFKVEALRELGKLNDYAKGEGSSDAD